ncbi:cysteine peptidase [Populibacterium corticicola]|uniref:Cysteine peptidase n=1 Tax=Populibacterium corticicola TaxID=1812826 RepID=A0ABW5XHB9_9MICO
MHGNGLPIARRDFLIALGVLAGAGAMTVASGGRAEALTRIDENWRQALADQYFSDNPQINVRPLQDGIEVWEGDAGGYMIVESSRRELLEGSPTAVSPYRRVLGDAAYLGPGEYYALGADSAVGLLNGGLMNTRELRAIARDASDQFHETLVVSAVPERVSLMKKGDGLPLVKAGDVKSRVANYTYITGSTLYPNTEGTCGWVAGSLITRYWHAKSTARLLLPTKYRSGTNMTTSPNFATYLQNGRKNDSWARNVKDQLIWNAKKQGVKHTSAWALGNIGMWNELNAGYPFILFGNIPTDGKKKGAHAVVAYGQTKGGQLITHYGWSGFTNVVLNGGLVGSNTKFRLT